MRSRSATRRRIGHALVFVAAMLAPIHASAQTATTADGSADDGDAPTTAPEIVAVGHGIGLGVCFVEVHFDPVWPPPVSVERWVLEITVQDATGAITIRSHASHDLDSADTVGRNEQRRLRIEEVAVADDIVAYKWGCGTEPRTVTVRFDVNDRDGRTILRDEVAAHPFNAGVHAPGEVPEDALVVDERGDLIDPNQELVASEAARSLGGGTSTTGGLLIVGLVLLMGVVGYLVWSRPSDHTVD